MIVFTLEYREPSPGANGARGQCGADLDEFLGAGEMMRVSTVPVDLRLADVGDSARVVHQHPHLDERCIGDPRVPLIDGVVEHQSGRRSRGKWMSQADHICLSAG